MTETKIKFQIKSRWFGNILFEGEYESMKDCVTDAVLTGTVLTGAVLTGALLTGAILRGALLTGAILRGADFTGAIFRRADFTGADFTGAILTGALLTDADFTRAIFTDADFTGADFRGAILTGAIFRGADFTGADFTGVPKIKNIHKAIYEAASKVGALDMSRWHTCETTHCRAGWVITLAGEAGAAMEFCMGTAAGAALIYLKSDPKLEKIPDFYADNETAMADMKRLAEGSLT